MALSDEVRQIFREASLQNEAARGLSGDDWARYRQIQDTYEERKRLECREYAREYPTRVEAARKQLIDKAAEKNRDLTHRIFRRDRFDKDAINRQAHRMVRDDHALALARLKAGKDGDIGTLLGAAEKRQEAGKRLLKDFSHAADRRSGVSRRGPSH